MKHSSLLGREISGRCSHGMAWQNLIATFCGLIVLLQAARAEPAAPKHATFYLHAGRLVHTYACAAGVESGHIEDGVLQADLRRADDRYLLISYSIPSRPNHPDGRCGGGEESYLVWLHVRASTVIASQVAQYESCWQDISGTGPKWSGQFCSVEYERFNYQFDTHESTITQSKASFDANAPEKGLPVISQPPEKQK